MNKHSKMLRNSKLFAILLGVLFCLALSPAQAQRVDQVLPASGALDNKIAAIVNDSVITTHDVEARVTLAVLSAGLPDQPEVRHRLIPQILRGLIDEQLEAQEIKRLDITISKDDLEKALAHIASDNHIPGGDMKSYLLDHGASPDSLVNQIRVALGWTKVIQRELRPRVDVADDEIDAIIDRIRLNAGKDEYLVSEIFLAVDQPKEEDQVHQFAENLIQQLKNGSNFSAAARQFSQGTGAATGGDIGWIQQGQLQPELDHALSTMHAGDIAGPIRSTSGYHILGVREKRTISLGDPSDVQMDLEQVFRPSSSLTEGLDEAETIRSTIFDCRNLQAKIAEKFPAWHWQNLGSMPLTKAPAWIVDRVHNIETGHASETIKTEKGPLLIFVCGRQSSESHINREAILNTIGTEKLELQARRLLRDLRRSAYLDVRLTSFQ